MFNFIRNYKKHQIFYLVMAVIILLSPIALIKEKESDSLLIIKNIGVDYVDNEYIVSVQVLVPETTTNFTDKYKVVTNKGKSVTDCFKNISLETGKDPDFSHCNIILVGGGFLDKNVSDALGYFTINKNVNSNTIILCTEDKAQEIFEIATNIDTIADYDPLTIIRNNKKYLYEFGITLDEFYKGYYSKPEVSYIGNIGLDEKYGIGVQDISSSQGSSGGDSSGGGNSGSGSKEKSVLNKGECTLFKKGKKVLKLTSDQIIGINLLRKETRQGFITIVAKDEENKDLKMDIELLKKSINYNVNFVNGRPVVDYKIVVDLNIQDFLTVNKDINVINREKLKVNISKACQNKIKEKITESLNLLKQENLDVINIYRDFYRFKYNEWESFINEGHLEDYLNYVNVLVDVKIRKIVY